MRLFIAIDFNEIKGALSEMQSKIDTSLANLALASAFHLTLKFLGEVEENKVGMIKQKLNEARFEPFSLCLDKIGVFPSENYIRVVWAGVSPQEQVISLQKEIEAVLVEFKFKKDFEFHPHITLARVKFVRDKERFVKSLKDIIVDSKRIDVKDFRLVKSTLKPDGPVYDDLEIFN